MTAPTDLSTMEVSTRQELYTPQDPRPQYTPRATTVPMDILKEATPQDNTLLPTMEDPHMDHILTMDMAQTLDQMVLAVILTDMVQALDHMVQAVIPTVPHPSMDLTPTMEDLLEDTTAQVPHPTMDHTLDHHTMVQAVIHLDPATEVATHTPAPTTMEEHTAMAALVVSTVMHTNRTTQTHLDTTITTLKPQPLLAKSTPNLPL